MRRDGLYSATCPHTLFDAKVVIFDFGFVSIILMEWKDFASLEENQYSIAVNISKLKSENKYIKST